jgi:hypothetical protein
MATLKRKPLAVPHRGGPGVRISSVCATAAAILVLPTKRVRFGLDLYRAAHLPRPACAFLMLSNRQRRRHGNRSSGVRYLQETSSLFQQARARSTAAGHFELLSV